ncbi:Glutamyl-tRNA(Gln) amidotransferase subunit A, mitochondrial [Holothuria leucospilota]|uniref:Glutamyl-tRNA(Gln) amidotransferase subunit A, mitochondrial n=1 Tax=Holothuria leucospilota TaxID=206669 RepID=A0A9Q1BIT5_HOLLE|nr:Glutamyl-tRNA(Gln) amidotransferase subunit A, mitochondrial [Holothuria leucospilota]
MLRLSIKELANQLQLGKISSAELCKKCQDRVQALEKLNAIVTTTFEDADQKSQQSDRYICDGKARHSLEGIPFAAKDTFCTKGVRTSCASKMLQDYFPPYTATVVEKLQRCGAVLLGKTNMDEYAMGAGAIDSIFGPTRNPWKYPYQSLHDGKKVKGHDWFISGGSSGGSAVAVATGMVMGSLGSDTGGSIRIPACFSGVVGLKPTYGLCSRLGLIPLVNSLDVPGVLARTVDDTAVLLDAISGEDLMDSTSVPDPCDSYILPDEIEVKGLTVGIPKEYHSPGLQKDILHVWSRAADIFENAGAKVVPVSLPHTQYSIACYSVLCAAEVASNMARYDGIEFGHRSKTDSSTEALFAESRHEGFNEVVRGRIFAGNFFTLRRNYQEFFQHAQKVRRLVTDDFSKVFNNGVDVLLTPTTICDGMTYEEFNSMDSRTQCEKLDVYTQSSNLAGVPALSLPIDLSSRGLPIGLQLIASCFNDKKLLMVAKWLEQQVNFPRHRLDEEIEELEKKR